MNNNIVSLHASYHCNNYGDMLLLRLFYDWVKSVSEDIVINFPLVDTELKDIPSAEHGLKNLWRSKCLVYCGGGYFGEQPRRKLLWSIRAFKKHLIIGIIAVVRRIPFAIIGVEFGPLSVKWLRVLVVWLAKHASIVVVRNKESKAFLEKYGVKNVIEGVDAVLTLRPTDHERGKTVLIHLPGLRFAPEQYEKIAHLLVDALLQRGIHHVSFIEDTDGQYKNGYDPVFAIFKGASIDYSVDYYSGVETLIQRLSEADYIVTTKLHVGITGAAMNKNVLSLYMHPKTIRFHKQIANEENCLPVSADPLEIKAAINHFFDNGFVLAESIRGKALYNRKAVIDFVSQSIFH